MSNVDYFRS